ncbi:MAG: response regulator [Verrucomicrobia bacterium]|nr:response regulator [Verrucomicrobiota bacterium]
MEPLAILVTDNVLLISRAVDSLCQLNYRVVEQRDPAALVATARELRPLFVLLDLRLKQNDPFAAITELKSDPATKHVLVLAFGDDADPAALDRARQAGADMVTPADAVVHYLPQLIDQLLAL